VTDTIRRVARLTAGLLATGALAFLLLGFGSGTHRAQVPRVLGEPKAEAVARVERHNLRAKVVRVRRAVGRLPARYAGRVVHQNFRGGITLPEGAIVRLTLYPGGKHHRQRAAIAARER
jgi:beta-lactam-binding protein with PASTA domain